MVSCERDRHIALRSSGALEHIASDRGCPDELKLAALVEEVGEVARAYHDGHDLTGELVHVAAVAVAWLESRE